MEIFEELYAMLNHENKNIADYSKLILTRTSNPEKTSFLNEKARSCTQDIKLIINEIIENKNVNNFTNFIIKSRGHLIHKLKAKDTTGRWAYYFVLVNQENEEMFMKAIEGDGTIDLEDYGEVIASCYGETPSQEVIDYLKEKYGFKV